MNDKDIQKFRQLQEAFKQTDHDSFATFAGGLRNNWVFVVALFGIGFWVVTNTLDSKNINSNQDREIKALETTMTSFGNDMSELRKELNDSSKENVSINNEILRRLDLVQKDIEVIKTQK